MRPLDGEYVKRYMSGGEDFGKHWFMRRLKWAPGVSTMTSFQRKRISSPGAFRWILCVLCRKTTESTIYIYIPWKCKKIRDLWSYFSNVFSFFIYIFFLLITGLLDGAPKCISNGPGHSWRILTNRQCFYLLGKICEARNNVIFKWQTVCYCQAWARLLDADISVDIFMSIYLISTTFLYHHQKYKNIKK